jgi:hypothetical protein
MNTLQDTYETEDVGIRQITLDDVCDKCGFAAMMLAVCGVNRELTFCGHHGRQYEETLRNQNFKIMWTAL